MEHIRNATDHDRLYWQYEYDVAAQYLIPLLKQWNIPIEGATFLDIGCGDGGGLSAFADAGMICKGFDIEKYRIDLSKILSDQRSFETITGNIYDTPPPFKGETFDLVLLHDVFEHLVYKTEALEIIRSYLAPKGRLIITFPPYYSAFGAHQQLLLSPLGKIPFLHLIPFINTKIIPNLPNERKPFVAEILKLARMKMGIAEFERIVRSCGFNIERRKFFLIAPNHIRFGLKPISAGIFGSIPIIREITVSGTVFSLRSSCQ